jgi:chloramphenicol-sensitive protein RarD
MRLTIMGFLQYLSPTITLVLATFAFHEHFGRVETISFGLVWAALMLVAFEGRLKRLVTAPERSG